MTFWRIGDSWINPEHIVRIERVEGDPNSAWEPAQTMSLQIYTTEHTPEGGWAVSVRGEQAERMASWLDTSEYVHYPADQPLEVPA